MKTTYLIIVALHTICEDPWNILHVMATEDDAEDLCVERYAPIIRRSPHLAKLLDGTKHQVCRDAIRLNGCVLTFKGAYSPSGLASRPVAKLFLDEVDKWPEWSGKEADPIKLARERTRTFWNRKIISASTPTTSTRYIWQQLQQSTNETYWVPCPRCGAFQRFVMGGRGQGPGIKWPEDVAPDIIQRDQLATYECGECTKRLTDEDKRVMLPEGKWVPAACRLVDGEIAGERPPRRHVGYHLWAAYSPWLTFSDIAAEFLRSKDHQSALMNFRNSWQAEPWEQTVNVLEPDVVTQCIDEYHEPPAQVFAMTAGVDVQRTGSHVYQYYSMRAWGKEGKSWIVRAGMSEDWARLYSVLFQSAYRDQTGQPLALNIVLIDSGFETDEVYQVCEMWGCWASKGDARSRRPYTISQTETSRGSGHFLRRVNFGTDYYKGHLHRIIRGGAWRLNRDIPKEYIDHMLAEQLTSEVEKKTGRTRYRWKLVADGRPNHYFDAEILNLVGADMLELRHRVERVREAETPTDYKPQTVIKERIFSS
jgi:phage terminase large subunit GpA-like protein